ncbi:hypothetical protein AArcSl_3220 [Halalkaliarchaeum desulfuricum]|uniref:Uncharacterized protein n=1 Tax=Halalkaliarchaeum desulfuricum TaxID=2055893 RepID=A0A343TP04_9EURY|nr:hypothetical protein AArcSl_3220 [Halalkaliarchaeum desulfuricum]
MAIDDPEIEEHDWSVEEFTDLSSSDQDRVRTMVHEGMYYSYGDDEPFHFDVVIYQGEAYRIELVEFAEQALFPTILTVPLGALGVLFVLYGLGRLYWRDGGA